MHDPHVRQLGKGSYQELLGADYDPHAGFQALRREAEFMRWTAAGNDPAAFAESLPRSAAYRADLEQRVFDGRPPVTFADWEVSRLAEPDRRGRGLATPEAGI